MPNRPMVYFIGAGPGDPALLTLAGARCLGRADVVVYDRLVHTALLRHARPDAERIDVGRAAPQGTDRDAIAYLLLEKYRDGKRVARLKWGDPFIFDDGGEEALFLHEHGVPFEVVPGIPAAVGVPPYAGVRGDLSRRRRHADAGARPRGRQRQAAEGRLEEPGEASTARSSATRARGSCRPSSRRCARTAGRTTSRSR